MKDRTYFEIGATFPIVYISQFFTLSTLSKSKRFRKSSSQKNYAFLSYDVYMTYITSRDISRESREATDQSERLNKYGSHRCFLPGRIGRKRLCRRLSFFGPRTLTVTLPKPLWSNQYYSKNFQGHIIIQFSCMKASRREIRFLIVDLLRFKYALESNSYLPNKH